MYVVFSGTFLKRFTQPICVAGMCRTYDIRASHERPWITMVGLVTRLKLPRRWPRSISEPLIEAPPCDVMATLIDALGAAAKNVNYTVDDSSAEYTSILIA